jgi:hypothetical protein
LAPRSPSKWLAKHRLVHMKTTSLALLVQIIMYVFISYVSIR